MKSMRQSVRSMLKILNIGKRVYQAQNGKEGWELLRANDIDLAIIDWNMPVMNGIELLNAIRREKKIRDMPVIMITAEAQANIVSEAAESDIDAYLLKPLTPKLLEQKISTVIHFANNPPKSTLYLIKARDHEEAGEIDAAIEEVKNALKEKPDSSRILRKLGLLFLEKNNKQTAIKCLQKAVAVNKQDAVSRFRLGEIYLQENDISNALKYYDEAIKISPRNLENGLLLGKTLFEHGMNNKAYEIFDIILKNSSQKLKSSEDIANICIRNRKFAYALSILEPIFQENPDDAGTAEKIGNINYNQGNSEKALAMFLHIEKLKPNCIDTKIKIAKLYVDMKKIFLADDVLNAVLRIEPENTTAIEMRKLLV
jgi:tetratricopeptide (TPR) repeat protein